MSDSFDINPVIERNADPPPPRRSGGRARSKWKFVYEMEPGTKAEIDTAEAEEPLEEVRRLRNQVSTVVARLKREGRGTFVIRTSGTVLTIYREREDA